MQRNSAASSPIICQAIQQLRAVQIGSASSSNDCGFGKPCTVGEMSQIQLSDEQFQPNDPHYNPNDSAMIRVICRID